MKSLMRVFAAPLKNWWQAQNSAIQVSVHNIFSHFFPQPQLVGYDMSYSNPALLDNQVNEDKDMSGNSVFDLVILMAAPKSKVIFTTYFISLPLINSFPYDCCLL